MYADGKTRNMEQENSVHKKTRSRGLLMKAVCRSRSLMQMLIHKSMSLKKGLDI
jgi:hypothetical protein